MPKTPKEIIPAPPSLAGIRAKVAQLGLVPADILEAIEWARTDTLSEPSR